MSDLGRLSLEFMGTREFLLALSMNAARPALSHLDVTQIPPEVRQIASEFVKNHAFPDKANEPFELDAEQVQELMSGLWSRLQAKFKPADFEKFLRARQLFEPNEANLAAVAWWRLFRNFAFRDNYPSPAISEHEVAELKSLIAHRLDLSLHLRILNMEKEIASKWTDGFGTPILNSLTANQARPLPICSQMRLLRMTLVQHCWIRPLIG